MVSYFYILNLFINFSPVYDFISMTILKNIYIIEQIIGIGDN